MTTFVPAHRKLLLIALPALLAFFAQSNLPSGSGLGAAEPDAAKPAKAAKAPKGGELPHPFPQHQKAPSLEGGVAWINTAGPIDLTQLKGKFVVLDFWTYCCINCMHVLPELKKLEKAYPKNVVVIGVHSAKFDGEEDTKNITDAVLRHEIEHPVVNDSGHVIWDKFFSQSWPTLRIIDPEGNLVAGHSGEISFEVLDGFMKNALPYYRQRGLLDEKPISFDLEAYKAQQTPLRFPGKVLADETGGRLFIADSNHNRIVVTKLDGTLLEVIGSGTAGTADGAYDKAAFDHPQGMALHMDTLYVADTENHRLRKVDLKRKRVETIAGNGKQGRGWPGLEALEADPTKRLPNRWVGKPLGTSLNSPWALHVHEKDLYIAMAGPHQIWKMPLSEIEIGPYAGNGREDIVDGKLIPQRPYDEGYSSFAQPSGLASDGEWLYVADSEGSSVRAVPFDARKEVKTVIGTSHLDGARLFTFGDVDGQGEQVKLQHCIDVAYAGGKIYVADTYNNKIKAIDPKQLTCTTVAGSGNPGAGNSPAEFDEPAGLSAAGGKLYVADTNNHVIRVIDLAGGKKVSTLEIKGLTAPKKASPVAVAKADKPSFPGAVEQKLARVDVQPVDNAVRLQISLQLPKAWKINTEAPMAYFVEPLATSGPVDRAAVGKLVKVEKPSKTLDIQLPLTAASGEDSLKVSMSVFYCQEGAEGLCKSTNLAWTVPVKLAADAKTNVVPLSAQVE